MGVKRELEGADTWGHATKKRLQSCASGNVVFVDCAPVDGGAPKPLISREMGRNSSKIAVRLCTISDIADRGVACAWASQV